MDDVQYNELKSLLEENIKETKEMKVVLIGQPEYNQHGLVHRTESLETHVKKHKKQQARAEGMRAILAAIVAFFVTQVKSLWELITT